MLQGFNLVHIKLLEIKRKKRVNRGLMPPKSQKTRNKRGSSNRMEATIRVFFFFLKSLYGALIA